VRLILYALAAWTVTSVPLSLMLGRFCNFNDLASAAEGSFEHDDPRHTFNPRDPRPAADTTSTRYGPAAATGARVGWLNQLLLHRRTDVV
jgi:hypothetical protein